MNKSNNTEYIKLDYQSHRFSKKWKKNLFIIAIFLILLLNLVLFIMGWFYIKNGVILSFYVLFFLSFILSNLWIISRTAIYIFKSGNNDWTRLSMRKVHLYNWASDILLIFLILSWILFLADWFYELSYFIALYNNKKNNLELVQNIHNNHFILVSFVLGLIFDFVFFSVLVYIYYRKSKKHLLLKGNKHNHIQDKHNFYSLIRLDSSSLTYSFIFYRIFQFFIFNIKRFFQKNEMKSKFKDIKKQKDFKFGKILDLFESLNNNKVNENQTFLKKEDEYYVSIYTKQKNPYGGYDVCDFEEYENAIKKSQPLTKDFIKWYSYLIITSLWAFLITIFVLFVVLFILQKNSAFNIPHYEISINMFFCFNIFWILGTFFINTFYVHFLTNNYKFFKKDNESNIYSLINEIRLKLNDSMKNILIFPILIFIRESLFLFNFSNLKEKYIIGINPAKNDISTLNISEDDKLEDYNFVFTFLDNKKTVEIELKKIKE